ncbi:hypothetical protein [Haloprofundus sp. MHR1]|uniref:hypothetical protein n=1 Tax=Haloprofundus sp. MHR1 TaxID=2572921 RepID=UPI0010BE5E7B|nr:hypothetical protein [Haloprofundus sp. MHR1]QCJ47251.1 hypothetical protein FCF25_09040 [Haloprofundus sp. MHR1]
MSQADRPTDSMLADVADPDRLVERLTSLEVSNVEKTKQVNGGTNAHTLGENMVRNLGMRRFPNVLEELENQRHPMTDGGAHPIVEHPRAFLDPLIHLDEVDKIRIECEDFSGLSRTRRQVFEWLAERPDVVSDLRIGGTDYFAYGPKGTGKTTFLDTWSARTLELNTDALVWRGSPARSEWLPMRPWTTLWLPSTLEAEARLSPPVDHVDPIEVDLEDVVREVRYYNDPIDLNQQLDEGTFNVVYPDPMFRGCTEVTREADEVPVLDHVSAWDAANDGLDADSITPTSMWWFAWAIAKIDLSAPMPVSWLCDELGNIMPEHASNSYHDLYKRIEAFRNKYVDARRVNFSMYGAGHAGDDLHNLMRKKQRWRVTMNGVDNPTNEKVVGMGKAPMKRQYTRHMKLGEALIWNKQVFAPFGWADIPSRFKVPGQLHIRFPEHEEMMKLC